MSDLLYPSIPRITGLTVVRPVERGTNNATYVHDAQGREWIRKLERDSGPAELLAETLGSLLGTAIKARVPDCAVCLDAGDRAYLSRRIDAVAHWNAEHADYLVNYEELGAMVTLDVLILNSDRHSENVLLQPSPDELHLRSWAIDCGNAAAGYPTQFAGDSKRLVIPRLDLNYIRDLPLDAMRPGADEAAQLAVQLSDETLHGFSEECCDIAGNGDAAALFTTLRARCSEAPTLLQKFWTTLGDQAA